jgi:RNA polymerase sigma factor (sigma-70 family)
MRTGPDCLHYLRSLLLRHEAAEMSDGQLLECFLARRDEAAFAALVRRHGPMVLGVCRRVVGQIQDAEDAFQATFFVLARKAVTVRPRELLGNWLYGVAYRTALKARTARLRRRKREVQVEATPEQVAVSPGADAARLAEEHCPELERLLDEELHGLPEKYRTAVVLCDLEGRSRREAARLLKLPESTLSGRVAAGRRRLAHRLARRGVGLTGAALAAHLTSLMASASVPARLAQTTVRVAVLLAAGKSAAAQALAPPATALMEGVMNGMLATKLKLVLTAGLVAAGLGICWLTVPLRAQSGPGDDNAAGEGRADQIQKERRQLLHRLDELKKEEARLKKLDELTRARLKELYPDGLRLKRSSTLSDEEFLKRACVELRGTPPTMLEVQYFLADKDPSKREKVVVWLSKKSTARHWWDDPKVQEELQQYDRFDLYRRRKLDQTDPNQEKPKGFFDDVQRDATVKDPESLLDDLTEADLMKLLHMKKQRLKQAQEFDVGRKEVDRP